MIMQILKGLLGGNEDTQAEETTPEQPPAQAPAQPGALPPAQLRAQPGAQPGVLPPNVNPNMNIQQPGLWNRVPTPKADTPVSVEPTPKRRWSLFSKKKKAKPEERPMQRFSQSPGVPNYGYGQGQMGNPGNRPVPGRIPPQGAARAGAGPRPGAMPGPRPGQNTRPLRQNMQQYGGMQRHGGFGTPQARPAFDMWGNPLHPTRGQQPSFQTRAPAFRGSPPGQWVPQRQQPRQGLQVPPYRHGPMDPFQPMMNGRMVRRGPQQGPQSWY